MTDKEIKSLIEIRWKDWKYGSSTEAKYKAEECQDILEIIDSMQEEPVRIDIEQELYKAFGQVKDFTLGMQIAKRFYDMGKNNGKEPISKVWHDSNEEQPNYASTVAIWNPKCKNGEIISRCTEVYPDRIWAYIDDLLKI